MPVEIEAKMRAPDLDAARALLKKAGAKRVGEVMETNTFFDTEDRELTAGDNGLRLRRKKSADGAEQFIVTFKGPRINSQIKQREELEFGVTDGPAARKMFEKIGFKTMLSFEKVRESWTFDGCSIELDTLPHIGTFIEIEGPDENTVLETRTKLGFDDLPLVNVAYSAMIHDHLRETSPGQRELVFE